jgi:hypothetical protein
MESTSTPGKIQVSEATAVLLRESGHYILEERSKPVEVKNAGIMQTYWLVGASEKHPTINASYIKNVREKADKELLRKFSALKNNKFRRLLGQSFLSSSTLQDSANTSNASSDESLFTILKHVSMTGSFSIPSNLSLSGSSPTSAYALDSNKLIIVGNVTFKDDENKWNISYVEKLADCIREIEYGNVFQGIIIDLEQVVVTNSDTKKYLTRMEELHYTSKIIGLTNDYFSIEALKLEIGISILMKPLDTNVINSILENQVLDL